MPNPVGPDAAKRQKAAAKRTLFPSRQLWEDPWEPGLTLARLRSQSAKLESFAALSERESDQASADRARLQAAIAALGLQCDDAERLSDDVLLITRWYFAPERRAKLHMGLSQHIAALEKSANLARRLHVMLATDLTGVSGLIDALPGEFTAETDQLDIYALTNDLNVFARVAGLVIDRMGIHEPGRRADQRRNVSIMLATEAIEQATRTAVTITRPTIGDWRFSNPSGAILRELLSQLGWTDERVLVSAFDKMRRKPRVKHSP